MFGLGSTYMTGFCLVVFVCFKIFYPHVCVPKRLEVWDPLDDAGVMVSCELPFKGHRS